MDVSKTTSVVGVIHELLRQSGSISHQKMINKTLKQPILVNASHN